MILKTDFLAMVCLSAALFLLWFVNRTTKYQKFVYLLIGLTACLWTAIVYLYLGQQ